MEKTSSSLQTILHINCLTNVDTSPYDDRLTPVVKILETLGAHHEVSSTGTSIGTSRFEPEMKTLTLIMHSNLYHLTSFFNLSEAKFLCDLINGAQINICAHIFQILGRIAGRSAARTCLPFCNLILKIMTLKGIHPPKDGMLLPHQGPIPLYSLQSRRFTPLLKGQRRAPPSL